MKRKSLIFISAFILNYLVVVFISIFFCNPDTYNFGFTICKLLTTVFSLLFGLLAYQVYLKYRGSEVQRKRILTPEEKMNRKKRIIYFLSILFILYNGLFIIIPLCSGKTIAMASFEKITDILNFDFYFDIYFRFDRWFHNAFPMWKYRTFVELVDKSNLLFNATSSETFHAMVVYIGSFFLFSKVILKEERNKLLSIEKQNS